MRWLCGRWVVETLTWALLTTLWDNDQVVVPPIGVQSLCHTLRTTQCLPGGALRSVLPRMAVPTAGGVLGALVVVPASPRALRTPAVRLSKQGRVLAAFPSAAQPMVVPLHRWTSATWGQRPSGSWLRACRAAAKTTTMSSNSTLWMSVDPATMCLCHRRLMCVVPNE